MPDETPAIHENPRPRASAWAAKYLVLAVPVIGVVELGAQFFFSHRAPRQAQWAQVKPLVEAWHRPDNAVVIAPYWSEPMARWNFGDGLMPLRDVARPDMSRYPRALEVSILGSHAPELEGWKLIRETKQDAFTLRELANPVAPNVTYDFVDHVAAASADVRIEQNGTTAVCPFSTTATVESGDLGGPPTYPATRFNCPGQPSHVFVGVTVIEDQDVHPRRCIWSHPPGGDAEIVSRFRGVPLGDKLHGFAGLGWVMERDRAVGPFTVRVTVGGEEVGRVVHQPGDFWKMFDVPLGRAAHTTGDVEFHVSGASHACFAVDSR